MKNHTDTKSRLKTNGIFLQLLWLIVAAIVTILLAVFVFRWQFSAEIDIHLHDTYYVIQSILVLIPLFLGTSFVLFLAKEWRKKFSNPLPNIIILAAGMLLVFFLTALQRLFPIGDAGWTFYPPLSDLGSRVPDPYYENEPVDTITYLIVGIQVLVVLALLHVTYCWGSTKRNN